PAASTWSTRTTAATPSTPARTATPTSARGRSRPTSSRTSCARQTRRWSSRPRAASRSTSPTSPGSAPGWPETPTTGPFGPFLPQPVRHAGDTPGPPGFGGPGAALCGSFRARSPSAATQLPVAADERVRRGVVGELGLLRGAELGLDPLGEHLAELDPPLVEGVDAPDDTLGEHLVLVERDELPEHRRGEPRGEDERRRGVPGEGLVRDELLGHPLATHLVGGLAEGERLRLGEEVGGELVVVARHVGRRVDEADEVRGNRLG